MIIDEFSLYVNPKVNQFLAVAAGYRVASIVATQSFGDLEVRSGEISAEAMKKTVMTNCWNKITVGGLGAEDAKVFQEEFGMEWVTDHQGTYANKVFSPKFRPDSYREVETDEDRFPYDYLMYGMELFTSFIKWWSEGVQQHPGWCLLKPNGITGAGVLNTSCKLADSQTSVTKECLFRFA